jgi:DNA-binding MarR family transcriptional regulator
MAAMRNPGLLAWLHLMRVFQKMQHHSMNHLREEYSLTPAQFEVLSRLSVEPGITQQALAEKLLVTKGNVCGLIGRLEEQGLVERRCDPEDKRSNLLFLTEAAQKLASEVIPAHEEFIQEHMSSLSEDEQRDLHTLLRSLDSSLKHHEH